MATIKKSVVKRPLVKKPLAKKPLVKAQKGISKKDEYKGPSVFRRYQDQLENEQLNRTEDSTAYYQRSADWAKKEGKNAPKNNPKLTEFLKDVETKATNNINRQKLKGQFGYDRNGYPMNPKKKLGGATKPLAKKQLGGPSNPKKPIVVGRKPMPPLPPDTTKPVIKTIPKPYLKGGAVKKKK